MVRKYTREAKHEHTSRENPRPETARREGVQQVNVGIEAHVHMRSGGERTSEVEGSTYETMGMGEEVHTKTLREIDSPPLATPPRAFRIDTA